MRFLTRIRFAGIWGIRPDGKADRQQPCQRRDAAQRPIEHVAADRIEYDVGAASAGNVEHGGAKVFAAIVDRMIGAVALCGFDLARAAGCGNDAGAERTADLDRRQSAGAGGAVHQQNLVPREPGAPHQPGIGGGVDGREQRSGGKIQRVGYGEYIVCVDDGFFRKAARGQAGADAIADPQPVVHVRRDFRHDAGDLGAGNVGQVRPVLMFARDEQQVRKTDAGRAHRDPRGAWQERRRGGRFQPQAFDPAELMTDYRAHELQLNLVWPTLH